MKKVVLVLLIACFMQFFSFANGKNEREPESTLRIGTTGTVEKLTLENGRISVDGIETFAFDLNTEEIRQTLSTAQSFHYILIERPDGPIGILELEDDELLFWVGDGIRANMGPAGLKVLPEEGVDSILIETSGKSWSVSVEKETPILWNEKEYIVFVSRVTKGKMLDQPEFSVDLVIMRK